MVAILTRGPDIIEGIRARHTRKAGLRPDSVIGVFASMSKSVNVTHPKSGTTNPIDIVATATTDDLDLEHERVLPDGADWSYLKSNGNLFLDHCYSSINAVARLRSLKRVGNGWLCRGSLLNDPDNENVRCVRVLAEAGGIGMSIGFEVIDGGSPTAEEARKYPDTQYLIRKWRGIEISYTAMPCNVACQSHAVVYGDDMEPKAARSRELLTKSKVPESAWGRLVPLVAVPKPRRVIVCDVGEN